jgi:hypothetical protein
MGTSCSKHLWRNLSFQESIARRVLASLLSLCLIISTSGYAPYAFGQSEEATKQQYQTGDFAKAEAGYRSLLAGAKAKKDRKKLAEYSKLIGICQFMQDDKPGAQASFKLALTANPSISISASEVLDESVIPFFNESKGGGKTAAPSAGAASVAAGSGLAPSAKPAKSTQLKIQSNVAEGQVMIDGINAGDIGQIIEADPGKIEITISSPGYKSGRSTVTVKDKMLNTFRIELNKVVKKVKAPPKVKAQPPVIAAVPKSGTGGKARGTKPAKPEPDLFQDPAEQPIPPPTMGRNVVGEFDAEAAGAPIAPAYTPPPPMVMQQQAYPQPMQQPMPMYQQPMYQQPMYQQPVYLPPPPPPVYQQPAYAPPPAYLPPEPRDDFSDSSRGRKRKGKNKGSDTEEVSVGMSILPLGIGQYYQDKYVLGTLFAGAQIGGVFFWYLRTGEADTSRTETDAQLAARELIRPPAPADQAIFDAETNTYVDEQNVFITALDQQALYGLVGAGAAYVISVLEAFLNPPKAKLAKNKPKKNRYSGFSLLDDGTGKNYAGISPENLDLSLRKELEPVFRVNLVPTQVFSEPGKSASLLLQIDYKY